MMIKERLIYIRGQASGCLVNSTLPAEPLLKELCLVGGKVFKFLGLLVLCDE